MVRWLSTNLVTPVQEGETWDGRGWRYPGAAADGATSPAQGDAEAHAAFDASAAPAAAADPAIVVSSAILSRPATGRF